MVPLTTGTLKVVQPDKSEVFSRLTAGHSYFRRAGVEHDVVNANANDFASVEIELK